MPSSPLTGLVVVVAVLVAATVFGVIRRRRDGRFRRYDMPAAAPGTPAGPPDGSAQPLSGSAAPPDGAAARLDGSSRPADRSRRAFHDQGVWAGLGIDTTGSGTALTLVQFSSAFCAPCRTTRVLCEEIARTTPAVRHVEIDAESHLDAVRALDVRRTPTLFIVDRTGRILRRASGAPDRTGLRGAVAESLAAVTATRTP